MTKARTLFDAQMALDLAQQSHDRINTCATAAAAALTEATEQVTRLRADPAAWGLTQQSTGDWIGHTQSHLVPHDAAEVRNPDTGIWQVWTAGEWTFRRNLHSSITSAVSTEELEAERIDLATKAARLAELTAPTPPSPTFQALTAAREKLHAAREAHDTLIQQPDATSEQIVAAFHAFEQAEREFDAALRADKEAQATPEPAEAASLDDLLGMIREAAERGDWTQVHEYALDIASIADGNINGAA